MRGGGGEGGGGGGGEREKERERERVYQRIILIMIHPPLFSTSTAIN